MKIDLFIKPSWKNLIITLLIWYLGICIYMLLGNSNTTFTKGILFYTKYSWPNFILLYVIVMWLIPTFLLKKKILQFLIGNFLLIFLIAGIRYSYFLYLDPNNYQYTYKNIVHIMSAREILSAEIIKGLQFTFIGYTYRFFFDWVIIERKKKKLETEKLKADLAFLRYQLNPHFLFNTINDIYYLAIIKSDKTADSLLILSDLLRYVLQVKHDLVSLEKELHYLHQFIELHKLRFPDEMVQFEMDLENEPTSYQIPPLLLATFLENAFKHGEPGTQENPISINLGIHNNILKYKVVNSVGKGLSKDLSSGIGIPNLEKRLSLIYPEKYKLAFHLKNNVHFADLEIELNHD